jgi:hypothetical protein
MNRTGLKESLLAMLLCIVVPSLQRNALAEEKLPDASWVIRRVLERAQATDPTAEESKYMYEKRSVSEELDATGKATKIVNKIYQVTPIEGVPFSRLIKIQNRDLTEEEREQQDRREERFRRKLTEKKSQAKRQTEQETLNSELIDRYDFKLEKRVRVDDRPVLVLTFRPKKAHAPEKTIEDKVLNRLAGQVWVDEAEAEVCQVRVGLTEDLSLGLFGMIGAIKQCNVVIGRQRLPDNVWVKKSFTVSLGGRKVLSAMGYRKVEEFYNFRKP